MRFRTTVVRRTTASVLQAPRPAAVLRSATARSASSPWVASCAANGVRGLLSSTTQNPANLHKRWSQEWIDSEAEFITLKAYERHHALTNASTRYSEPATKQELESISPLPHYKPVSVSDKVAYGLVAVLEPFTHWFFKERYNHHACVLETVAAVPGMVAGMLRHMRSLRTMSRDYGWIPHLLEEAENERMHLLTWMTVTQPTRVERALVLSAQFTYFGFYAVLYGVSPKTAHRFVGYLEEKAVQAYTDYLTAIDAKRLPNPPAPELARKYWNLPDDATIRDVVLHVRADETMHRNLNHYFSEMHQRGAKDTPVDYPTYEQMGAALGRPVERVARPAGRADTSPTASSKESTSA